MAPVGFRTRENSSSFEIQTQSQSTAQRTRSTSSSIETQSSISTLNSRIRSTTSTMNVEFQTTTFGQRARGIDLYAFTNGALVAQASVIRDSNTLANTFFNVGTDFIRTRNVSAEGDATVFISNIPTRIRASNIETQNAFSFVSTVAATKRISQSLVASFNNENQFSLTRGATANLAVNATLSLTPNVTRAFDSAITSTTTQTATPSVTKGFQSTQSAIFTQQSVISAIFGCDMVAFDDASVFALVGVRKRFSSDMFMVPGAVMFAIATKIHPGNSNMFAQSQSQLTATRIRPFVANTFQSISSITAVGRRIRDFDQSLNMRNDLPPLQIFAVVLYNILPTTFSVNVADTPLANTFFSRTRETGVNI
jgi:hypothetical protein